MKCLDFSSRVAKIRPKLTKIISSEGMSLALTYLAAPTHPHYTTPPIESVTSCCLVLNRRLGVDTIVACRATKRLVVASIELGFRSAGVQNLSTRVLIVCFNTLGFFLVRESNSLSVSLGSVVSVRTRGKTAVPG